MSVGFTDGDGDLEDAAAGGNSDAGSGSLPEAAYTVESTALGKIYIPKSDVEITGTIRIRYEKHPWIEQFELDGIKAAFPVRTGYGSRDLRACVSSLNTIYADAYTLYDSCGRDAKAFFAQVVTDFARVFEDPRAEKMQRMFCGYVENLWREGTREICETVTETVLPAIFANDKMKSVFDKTVTQEFKSWISTEVNI